VELREKFSSDDPTKGVMCSYISSRHKMYLKK